MDFEITFSIDNAAFGDCPMDEAARILRDIAQKLEGGQNAGNIRDINGNTIGQYGACGFGDQK